MLATTTTLLSVFGCSDFIMSDSYGLSVRTMDLGEGPTFARRLEVGTRTLAECGLSTDGARVYLCLRQRTQAGAWVRAEHAHRAARHGGMRA